MSAEPRPLTPSEAAKLLESAGAMIRAEFGAMTEGALVWHPAPGERARRDCQRAAGALIEEFASMRRDSVAMVAALRVADLGRGGRHPKVGPLRVTDLLHEWVHHDRNHLRQMLANVQTFTWPTMGNAQRFSTP